MTKINNSFFGSFTADEEDDDNLETNTDEITDKVKEPVEEEEELEEEESTEDVEEELKDTTTAHTDTTDTDEDTNEDEDTDFFTTIINDQAGKGVLFFDEDKEYEGSGEEIFDEVINDTLAKRWEEEYVKAIPEEYQSLFAALKAGKDITDWMDNALPVDYSSVDVTDEANQKDLIKSHLATTGMDEDDIEDALQEYEDSGTLEKNAKKAVKYLEKAEQGRTAKYEEALKAEQEIAEARQEEDFKKFKSEVLSTEDLGGVKLSKTEREKLFDHITKPVNKSGESQLVINQKSREAQLLVAYMDMKGFKFSDLEKKAESKAASGLRAKLSKTTDVNAKSGGTRKQESTESKNIGGWQPW